MKLLPPPGERALPILAGVILALSYPPVELLLPPFIGLVPLLVFIADRPPGPEGRWSATRAGLLTGLVHFGLQLYWLAVALIFYSLMAIPAYLGTVLIVTALTGVFAWAVHYTRERLGLPLVVLAALYWPALEWVQGHLGDIEFPWLGLGSALAPFPALAGAADLVGSRGLTVWIAAVNGLLAMIYLHYREGRPVRRLAAGLAALVLVPATYGIVRHNTVEMRPAAGVAVVQPNIPEDLKLDRTIALDTSLTAATRLTLEVQDAVDLVAWPEVTLPIDFARSGSVTGIVQELSGRVDAPILVGTYGVDRADGDQTIYNSAFLVDATEVREPRYDKRKLVPFVERIPFVDPDWLLGLIDFRYFGGLGRGQVRDVLRADNGSGFGVLICYESIFAPLSARYRRDGADFLVNVTNDAWYGREEWWARTIALWQHPAHMVMRAIENRMGVARAANTGISMFIDPLGRTYQRTELFEADVRVDTVYTTDERTLYTRWGDWLATLATILGVGVVGVARFRDQRPEIRARNPTAEL